MSIYGSQKVTEEFKEIMDQVDALDEKTKLEVIHEAIKTISEMEDAFEQIMDLSHSYGECDRMEKIYRIANQRCKDSV